VNNMKPKKIPMRTCVVTKECLPKKELLRIVRTPSNEVIVDETGKQNGRGAYIKKDLEVIEKAKKTKILERHLQVPLDDCIYEEMSKKII